MRFSLLIPALLIFLPLSHVSAAPFLEESFEYETGPLAGQDGGTGFQSPWITLDATQATAIVNGGLNYQVEGGGLIQGGDSALRISGPISAEEESDVFHRATPTIDAPSFYLRYLISVPASALFHEQRAAGFWLQSARQWTFLIHRKNEATSWGARIGDSATETIPPEFRKGETYLVVARFRKDEAGGKDRYNRIDLWINPTAQEESTPHYTAVGRGVREQLSFAQVGFRVIGFTQEQHGVTVDALAAGQEWSDVIPSATAP